MGRSKNKKSQLPDDDIHDLPKSNDPVLVTIVVSKASAMTYDEAKALAMTHGATKLEADETPTCFRFKQKSEAEYYGFTYRRPFGSGVTLVMGKPR
jgi:hypothetical protein